MRNAILILLCLFLVLPGRGVQAAETLSAQDVVAAVLRENPSIQAARAKWEMMKARVPQARAWEDLRLSAGSVAGRFVSIPAESFMDQNVMLEQELPVSGKNLSRARAATAEAAATFEELRRAELDAVTQAKEAYDKLAGAYGQLEINDRNQALLKQFVDISRAKYEAGVQSQADVLLAETDLARLSEARAQIQRDISDQETQINVLTNKPARTPVGHPERIRFAIIALSPERLEAAALANRPEVLMALRNIESQRAALQLAERQWIPDPALNVTGQRYNSAGQPVSELDLGISMPLTWLNHTKYSAGVTEARKSLENAEREYGAVHNDVLGLVRDQTKKIATFAENYQLFHAKIVPLADQAVQTTRTNYESDKTSFLELITVRRNLQDVDSTELDYLTNYNVSLSELEAIVGDSTSAGSPLHPISK